MSSYSREHSPDFMISATTSCAHMTVIFGSPGGQKLRQKADLEQAGWLPPYLYELASQPVPDHILFCDIEPLPFSFFSLLWVILHLCLSLFQVLQLSLLPQPHQPLLLPVLCLQLSRPLLQSTPTEPAAPLVHPLPHLEIRSDFFVVLESIFAALAVPGPANPAPLPPPAGTPREEWDRDQPQVAIIEDWFVCWNLVYSGTIRRYSIYPRSIDAMARLSTPETCTSVLQEHETVRRGQPACFITSFERLSVSNWMQAASCCVLPTPRLPYCRIPYILQGALQHLAEDSCPHCQISFGTECWASWNVGLSKQI